jgi:hypothetical protein
MKERPALACSQVSRVLNFQTLQAHGLKSLGFALVVSQADFRYHAMQEGEKRKGPLRWHLPGEIPFTLSFREAGCEEFPGS